MKAINFVLLCLTISFVSCSKENEEFNISLGKLKLSPETLEFFTYYEKTKQLIFKRQGRQDFKVSDLVEYNPSSLTKNKDTAIDTDYWIFNKIGGTEIKYDYRNSGVKYKVEGRVEKRLIRYIDADGNILEFKLVNWSYPSTSSNSWNKLHEDFEIRYSAPCWTTLLRYKTVDYNNIPDSKYGSIMHEHKEVDDKVYNDLMELGVERDGAHYKVMASKSQGVVRIIDQDNDIIWN